MLNSDNQKQACPIDEMQADQAMSLKTWWAMPLVQPLARKMVVYVVNHSSISANQITLTSIVLRMFTAFLFFRGTRTCLMLGAIFYTLAYVCDCADGTVARIQKQSSELGRYLDHVGDLTGDIIILISLSLSQGLFGSSLFLGLFFMHVAECYISYLAGFAIEKNMPSVQSPPTIFALFNLYRNWWFSRNLKSFLSFPDYTAFVFVIAPLLGFPKTGLQIGFWFLLMTSLYTIFSTFISIHSGIKNFP